MLLLGKAKRREAQPRGQSPAAARPQPPAATPASKRSLRTRATPWHRSGAGGAVTNLVPFIRTGVKGALGDPLAQGSAPSGPCRPEAVSYLERQVLKLHFGSTDDVAEGFPLGPSPILDRHVLHGPPQLLLPHGALLPVILGTGAGLSSRAVRPPPKRLASTGPMAGHFSSRAEAGKSK